MKTNTIILIGRLGKEPRVTQAGTTTVANFPLQGYHQYFRQNGR